MRIGIVTTWFERGAAMVSRAYRDLLREKHEVFIYARGGSEFARNDSAWDGPEVTWGRRDERRPHHMFWDDFRRWVLDRRLDVLFFNEQQWWPPVVFARRELPVALGSYIDYYTERTVPLFRLFDFVVCNTRRHESAFADHPGVRYVPWGADAGVFSATTDPVAPGEVVFFLSTGMNMERKGGLTALRAFELVEGPCRFVLHTQQSLSEFPEVLAIAERDPRIEIVQGSVHAPGLYHRGDVYVYPTVLEGIGLTVAEALCRGLPTIAPDCAPMNEFVRHGVNGRLVPVESYRGRADGYFWATCHCRPEDFAREMRHYVERRDRLGELKRRTRADAEERLDWRTRGDAIRSIFEDAPSLRARREPLPKLESQALELRPIPSSKRRLLKLARFAGLHDRPFVQHRVHMG